MFSVSGPGAITSYLLILSLSAALSYSVTKRHGFLAGLTILWMFWSALRVFASTESPFIAEDPAWMASLSDAASSAMVTLMLIIFAVSQFKARTWIVLIQVTAVLNAVVMFFYRPGIFFNHSMGGCFLACCLPLFFTKKGKVPTLSAILIPIAIIWTMKAQPIALLGFLIMIYAFRNKSKIFWWAIASMTLTVVAILLSLGIVSSHTRFDVWASAFQFFHEHVNYFIGSGLGTFFYIGPSLTLHSPEGLFLQLHSDWLQIGFETGLIGLVLSLALFFQALYRSRRDMRILSSLVAFGCFGIANFPLHNPISAVFGAVLMRLSLSGENI